MTAFFEGGHAKRYSNTVKPMVVGLPNGTYVGHWKISPPPTQSLANENDSENESEKIFETGIETELFIENRFILGYDGWGEFDGFEPV